MPVIRDVMLISSFFVDHGEVYPDKISYALALTFFEREKIIQAEDGNSLLPVKMVFDLFKGDDSPPFRLLCGYRVVYEFKDQKELELLPDHVVLAHVIPYLREHVSGITVKSRFPALFMATVNTYVLLDEYHKSNQEPAPLNP